MTNAPRVVQVVLAHCRHRRKKRYRMTSEQTQEYDDGRAPAGAQAGQMSATAGTLLPWSTISSDTPPTATTSMMSEGKAKGQGD